MPDEPDIQAIEANRYTAASLVRINPSIHQSIDPPIHPSIRPSIHTSLSSMLITKDAVFKSITQLFVKCMSKTADTL